jgi:hypothetical protein
MATAIAPAAPQGVVARLPRGTRALAARPPRGQRAGQGRSQAQGQTTRSCARKRGSRHEEPHPEIEEPRTADEFIARYRDVRRHLYSPATALELADGKTRTDHVTRKAIATIPEPFREPDQRPSQTPVQY